MSIDENPPKLDEIQNLIASKSAQTLTRESIQSDLTSVRESMLSLKLPIEQPIKKKISVDISSSKLNKVKKDNNPKPPSKPAKGKEIEILRKVYRKDEENELPQKRARNEEDTKVEEDVDLSAKKSPIIRIRIN